MEVLYFIQDDKRINIGLFDNFSDIKEFIKKLFADKDINDIDNIYDLRFKPEDFPKFIEINFRGNLVPITRFAFAPKEDIYLGIDELTNLSSRGKGKTLGFTVIENYAIANEDLKEYIEKRENAYKRVKKALEKRGYKVGRSLQNSEDGEAITISGKGNRWFFAHLDPSFVENLPEEEKDFEKFIDGELEEE